MLSIGHYILDSLLSRLGVKLKDDNMTNGLMVDVDVEMKNSPARLTLFKPSMSYNLSTME